MLGTEYHYSELFRKIVVLNTGEKLGYLQEIYIEPKTGAVKYLGVLPLDDVREEILTLFERNRKGLILIQKEDVLSIRDFVIVRNPSRQK
ncbi:MAG TPA: PRC-barrel domain containing protein [Euryarchaeota archaeon]|nr:PRC-barrel domain containing protein [Euryarchaeota archaeon]